MRPIILGYRTKRWRASDPTVMDRHISSSEKPFSTGSTTWTNGRRLAESGARRSIARNARGAEMKNARYGGGRFVRLAKYRADTAILPRLTAPRHTQSPAQYGRATDDR